MSICVYVCVYVWKSKDCERVFLASDMRMSFRLGRHEDIFWLRRLKSRPCQRCPLWASGMGTSARHMVAIQGCSQAPEKRKASLGCTAEMPVRPWLTRCLAGHMRYSLNYWGTTAICQLLTQQSRMEEGHTYLTFMCCDKCSNEATF